jgi:hypothetical protein
VEQFDDVSNTGSGTTPGNVTFDSHGLAFKDPANSGEAMPENLTVAANQPPAFPPPLSKLPHEPAPPKSSNPATPTPAPPHYKTPPNGRNDFAPPPRPVEPAATQPQAIIRPNTASLLTLAQEQVDIFQRLINQTMSDIKNYQKLYQEAEDNKRQDDTQYKAASLKLLIFKLSLNLRRLPLMRQRRACGFCLTLRWL